MKGLWLGCVIVFIPIVQFSIGGRCRYDGAAAASSRADGAVLLVDRLLRWGKHRMGVGPGKHH
jgi:hypothetical protein